eukprot:jgi/Hompol1/4069/HPOL_000900-RA
MGMGMGMGERSALSLSLPVTVGAVGGSTQVVGQVRFKTFRKTLTKAFKKRAAWVAAMAAAGTPVPEATYRGPVMENKFWKVVGGFKVYKSVSPGSTNRRHPTRFHLHRGSCVWRLSYGKRSTGGRNRTGRITVRHRGGGHKKRVRCVDFMRETPGDCEVAGARRRKGWRPAVRGIAMSAYNHPHGGGHKSKGNKAPRSPWGWKTKGWKTVRRKRWFVVTPKSQAKKNN